MSLSRRVFSCVALSLLATTACGDEPSKQFADAATPDAPVGPVAGTVKAVAVRYGQILKGATVIFQNADGSTISTKLTDANGEATETMLPGGVVNILLEQEVRPLTVRGGPANEVISFLGVKPGDVLRTSDVRPTLTFVTREFTLPPLPPGAILNIITSCANNGVISSTPPITVSLDAACTTTGIFVAVRNNMNLSVGSFYKANVTIPATGAINLSAETLVADRQLGVAVTNTPAEVASLMLTGSLGASWLDFASSDNYEFSPSPVQAANTGTISISGASGLDLLMRLNLRHNNGARQDIFELTAPATEYPLNLTGQLLPWIDSRTALDIATGEVTWTETPGAAPEAILFEATVVRSAGDLSFARTVIAPYRMGSIKIPKLPGAAARFDFVATDTPYSSVALVNVGVGYDLLRPVLARTYNNPALQDQRGRVRFSYSPVLE